MTGRLLTLALLALGLIAALMQAWRKVDRMTDLR